jgi:hypothetical protein
MQHPADRSNQIRAYLDIIIENTIDITVALEQLESPFVLKILKLPHNVTYFLVNNHAKAPCKSNS